MVERVRKGQSSTPTAGTEDEVEEVDLPENDDADDADSLEETEVDGGTDQMYCLAPVDRSPLDISRVHYMINFLRVYRSLL